MSRVQRRSEEQSAWEDEVLRLVMLSLLAGDSRRAMPEVAPRDWNKVSHIGFRRIFLADDLPKERASVVVMFSFEDFAKVVLAIAFPLEPLRGEPVATAQKIVERFIDRVSHQAHAVPDPNLWLDPNGPRLQWLAEG